MNQVGLPEKQGLYDPQYEHDACGIGIVVNIKGKKSHDIVCQALTALNNLTHRGGNGSEAATGDGAGILLQVPDAFLRKTCPALGINLPAEGEYGVGMMFLPNDPSSRENCEKQFELIVKEEGQNFLGWRSVPNDPSSLGKTAKACMPFIKQVFISKGPSITDELSFERKLYVIRKRAEKELCYDAETGKHTCYFASLSSRTIVYKGMLLSEQVGEFYTELNDPELVSALAMVHSRFSTNTFPSWERAHPNRYIIHNGEINTIRGNENWMYARQSKLKAEVFGDDMQKLFPIINTDGSDSAKFDNSLEFLNLSGMPLPRAVMMMIPEPWSKNETMSAKKKAYYEYLGCLMEPWDGPAAIGFTDGRVIGAVLDRNGLRPSRYYVTKDDMLILASEVGVLDIAPENVLCKERLHPGKMLLVDTIEGRIISDEELKEKYSSEFPYEKWLKENMVNLSDLPHADEKKKREEVSLIKRQRAFGYTYEDIKHTIQPMAFEGVDPVGAMGIDTPLAVLSDKSQLLYNYFKQLFAQVTNPPIDAIREEIVTGNETYMGSSGNPLKQIPENARQIKLDTPVITDEELERLKNINIPGFKSAVIHILYKVADGVEGLERAINNMCIAADRAFESGKNIIILSDRGLDGQHAAIPALLAVSALHHHTINNHRRTQISIVLESAEPREVHHFACLLGYGASAINPYLVFETIEDMASVGFLEDVPSKVGIKKYIKCVTKGVVKILSKMGISTIKSYRGAQIFEAIGIGQDVIDKYFRWTPSRIGGIGLPEIAEEIRLRHQNAFDERLEGEVELDAGGSNQWRKDGEYHMYNPETIFKLQQSVRNSDYNQFKEYTKLLDDETQQKATLRGLMKFKPAVPVSIEEVESVDEICKRFKTGAMSYGSISKEAHEALAIAMNRLGGKSNTGEGGEDPARFIPDENGDSRSSAIKQVASGRFGVTSHYLVNALELQIKMAQGAKPGEGGQLPGKKVYPWVARTRHSTPGVGLISPPPHHDIYSIEDLSELIHDLKNANRKARISVKLVSEVGVGTIAAGVAKGRADVILVSGYDGGTGASPRTSIKHAGLPWELGLAETHQTLMMNDLRSRVIVETDGKLMTGRDVVVAALLGAEEYGFATAPLVTLGCVMMRVCNLDTCPVGVATQNPELRAKFCGKPEYVVNFMKYIAQEMREIMAQLGFRTINEMVGRSDMLEMNDAIGHWKTKGLDFSAILNNPFDFEGAPRICMISQDHGLENSLDIRKLLDICKPALENGEKVSATLPVKNTDRVVGTILGSEITAKYGAEGLPEDTVTLSFKGSAGQSFGAFIPKGLTLKLEGDANDYVGKGLSGGKIAVYPPKEATFLPEENIIIGNVAFYGATSGEAYIRGIAGERFCVRNSGINAVVEAVGDHGCEYMTGGQVVILGSTGRNFAAGMSGGIAYIYDEKCAFRANCNMEMVDLEKISPVDSTELKSLIKTHLELTGSTVAAQILNDWEGNLFKFIKVIPKDYKRMQQAIKRVQNTGLTGDAALLAAFEENNKELARSGAGS